MRADMWPLSDGHIILYSSQYIPLSYFLSLYYKYISLTVINSRFIFPDFYSIVHIQSIMVFTFLISRWRSLVIKYWTFSNWKLIPLRCLNVFGKMAYFQYQHLHYIIRRKTEINYSYFYKKIAIKFFTFYAIMIKINPWRRYYYLFFSTNILEGWAENDSSR
jgi:hypothetical protein